MGLSFESAEGIAIELVKLYSRGTYLGSTVECKAVTSSFLLEDSRNSFIPLDWHKYSSRDFDLSSFLNEGALPDTVCVGLFAPKDLSKNEAALVVWFQNDFFEDPCVVLNELISNMHWRDAHVVSDLLS